MEDLRSLIAEQDFCFVPAVDTRGLLAPLVGPDCEGWDDFHESWNRLEQDHYMRDGGTYRYRRHATFRAPPSSRQAYAAPHQPHYQSLAYNQLNGGIARYFEPIEPRIAGGKLLSSILTLCCELFGGLSPDLAWHIETHQFRIDASQRTAASPTPEGLHRDGVNFVFMMMIQRTNVAHGDTSIYDRARHHVADFTLTAPFDAAIVNDQRVLHSVTPIAPIDPGGAAFRDVLVVTFRESKDLTI
jgi:hypothetical protein